MIFIFFLNAPVFFPALVVGLTKYASSVCFGIVNMPCLGNDFFNRQTAGVGYIILILYTKSLYNQIHKGVNASPAGQEFPMAI